MEQFKNLVIKTMPGLAASLPKTFKAFNEATEENIKQQSYRLFSGLLECDLIAETYYKRLMKMREEHLFN